MLAFPWERKWGRRSVFATAPRCYIWTRLVFLWLSWPWLYIFSLPVLSHSWKGGFSGKPGGLLFEFGTSFNLDANRTNWLISLLWTIWHYKTFFFNNLKKIGQFQQNFTYTTNEKKWSDEILCPKFKVQVTFISYHIVLQNIFLAIFKTIPLGAKEKDLSCFTNGQLLNHRQ